MIVLKSDVVLFYFLAFLQFFKLTSGLKCFLCNINTATDLSNCPSSTSTAKDWSSDETKYQSIGAALDFACAVGYSNDTGQIYLQSGVPISLCYTDGFQNTIIIKVAKLGGSGAAVNCCSKDGCNWNASTAQKNQDYGTITQSFFYIPDIVNWTWIIVGAVIGGFLLLCCLCCCIWLCIFFCCKKKKKRTPEKVPLAPNNPYLKPNQLNPNSQQQTPTKQIGVRPSGQPQPPPKDRKPVKKPDPPPKDPPKKPDTKKILVDPLSDKSKDIFAKEQSDWVEIWKNANDPNYKGPLSKKKSKYETK